MSKIAIVGAFPRSLVNFRGDLIKDLTKRGHQVFAMSSHTDKNTAQNIESLGANFLAYTISSTKLNPIADFKTFCNLREKYNSIKPEVVLAYTIKPVIWSGIALMRNKHTKFYALITGLGYSFEGKTLPRKLLTSLTSVLYKISLSRANAVIFQNKDNMHEFISRGIIKENKAMLIQGSGVNTTTFKLSNLPKGDKPTFLTACRLLNNKGLREYYEAAKIVKKEFPNTQFNLLGPAYDSPEAISLSEIKSWQKEGIINYLGFTSDIQPFINQCHIYVLASHAEGLPRSTLEAMSKGRPIITTNAPGCKETVIDGLNGYTVPIKDHEQLAKKMIKILKQKNDWENMGLASRQIIKKKFSVKIINQKIIKLLEKNNL